MLIDTHCHLTSGALRGRATEIVDAARAAGVTELITVATDAEDSHRTTSLADRIEGLYATVGVHPHEAAKVRPGDIDRLRELRHNPHVVAWGEIGLDYHYDLSPRDVQQAVFAEQLAAAHRADLPVVIHCREAVDDTVGMLIDHGFEHRRVVFHCFTGTAAEARRIMARGWWLSLTGIVTFRNSTALQDIARDYPLDALMIETDAPYLTPEPHRRVRPNVPAMAIHTARFLAELKGISLDRLAQETTANARRFFALPG